MTTQTALPNSDPPVQKSAPKLLWLWITLGIIVVLGVTGYLFYRYYFYANIRPTVLSQKEQVALNGKIERLESAGEAVSQQAPRAYRPGEVSDEYLVELNQVRVLPPIDQEQRMREEHELRRTLVLTERELNGMLNHNTDLGESIKIQFKSGYIDIQYVQPVDEDVAILGGKTIRMSVDISLAKRNSGELDFRIKDVNVGGIPLPAAWLEIVGIMKNENLLDDLPEDYTFFRQLAAGIEAISIESGEMRIRLAE